MALTARRHGSDRPGPGVITQVTPMGNDALVEIAFENVGTKRLMLKAASQHMEKVR